MITDVGREEGAVTAEREPVGVVACDSAAEEEGHG